MATALSLNSDPRHTCPVNRVQMGLVLWLKFTANRFPALAFGFQQILWENPVCTSFITIKYNFERFFTTNKYKEFIEADSVPKGMEQMGFAVFPLPQRIHMSFHGLSRVFPCLEGDHGPADTPQIPTGITTSRPQPKEQQELPAVMGDFYLQAEHPKSKVN